MDYVQQTKGFRRYIRSVKKDYCKRQAFQEGLTMYSFFCKTDYRYISHNEIKRIVTHAVLGNGLQCFEKYSFSIAFTSHFGAHWHAELYFLPIYGKSEVVIIATAVATCFGSGQVKSNRRLFVRIQAVQRYFWT